MPIEILWTSEMHGYERRQAYILYHNTATTSEMAARSIVSIIDSAVIREKMLASGNVFLRPTAAPVRHALAPPQLRSTA